jgi:hypothetical protein
LENVGVAGDPLKIIEVELSEVRLVDEELLHDFDLLF